MTASPSPARSIDAAFNHQPAHDQLGRILHRVTQPKQSGAGTVVDDSMPWHRDASYAAVGATLIVHEWLRVSETLTHVPGMILMNRWPGGRIWTYTGFVSWNGLRD